MADRMNVLWILTDEQRADSLGCYGSQWAHSPNVDALAGRGVRFTNCTIQSPLCAPSRSAILTGRYAHSLGVVREHQRPLPDVTPLTQVFERAGYQVACLGKLGYSDPAAKPFAIHEGGPGYGGPGASPFDLKPPFHAKDYGVVFMPFKCPWGERLVLGGKYPLPADEQEPGLLAARAERFLLEEAKGPFFLCVSIIAPHTPVLAADGFYGRTNTDAVGLPWERKRWDERTELSRYDREVLGPVYDYTLLSDDEVRRARTTYYDLCTQVDAAVGRVLAALERSGRSEDTLVIFTTDHGNMLGEHGLAQKESFFDPVVQVPLVMACPGRIGRGVAIEEPVETIDILPTAAAMAGLELTGQVEGRELTAAMQTGHADPDRITFAELDNSGSHMEQFRRNASTRVMARTRDWKLVYALNDAGFGEDGTLYDLKNDPGETVNLFYEPRCAEVVRRMKGAIGEWRRRK